MRGLKRDACEKAQPDRMVALVDQMLALHQQQASAKLPDDKCHLAERIYAPLDPPASPSG